MENALDQAINSVKGTLGGVGNFMGQLGQGAQQELGNMGQQFSQGVQNFTSRAGQDLQQLPQQIPQEALQIGGMLQPHAENILQGASLGYYQAPQQDQQGMNPLIAEMEKGAGAAAPFLAATAATGGAADAFLPEALSEGLGGNIFATAGGGALTGLASPAQSAQQRTANTFSGGLTGAGFGALGGIGNPLIEAGIGSLSMAGLTALQGGNKNQILANAVLGIGTPLFFKGVDAIGGGESGSNLMSNLFQQFGTDSYRFLANKDLIQRVVTGQGTPEDIAQFNILNNLGAAAEAARTPGGISVEDQGTRVAKQGPVWDFLQTMFPNSFTGGTPASDFTDPQKTPLQAIPEMALDQNENDALQKIDERNPNPQEQTMDTNTAIQQKIAEEGGQVPGAAAGEKGLTGQDIQQNAQDLVTPEGAQKLGKVYQDAIQNRPQLDQLLDTVGQQTGANVVSNMKDPNTLLEKTVEKRNADPDREYGLTDVNDVVRGRLVYDNMQQIQNAVQVLRKTLPQGVQITKEDNYFQNPRDLYQGYHVDLKFPNGQHSEVQFHTWKSYAAALATHGLHESFGDGEMPQDAASQKANMIDQVNKMSDDQAKALAEQIEQQNAPRQQEAQQKVQQVVEQQPEKQAQESVIEALMTHDSDAAEALHQVYSAEHAGFPTLDELQQEAASRQQDQALQAQEGQTDAIQNSVMRNPDIAQHKLTIRKAVRVYNLVKAKGIDDVATITTKVPGLDVALQSMRDKGVDVQNMDHLVALAKQLPKKNEKLPVRSPQTAAEALVNTKLAQQTKVPVKSEPVEMNGTKFTQDALPKIQQTIEQNQQNQSQLDQPGYFAQNVIPDISWKEYLAHHPDFNNHEGGAKTIIDKKGYFAYIDPRAVVPDQKRLNVTIDSRVTQQFQNQQPIIIRANRDGTFQKVDGQHRVLASRALGVARLPAIVLDDNSSSLDHAYTAIKNGEPVQTIQGRPVPTETGKMPVKNAPQPMVSTKQPAGGDFVKEMDEFSQQNPGAYLANSQSDLQKQTQLENATGKSETVKGGAPAAQTPQFTQQPKNGYVKELQPAITRIAQGALNTYPMGRDFTKIIVGRRSTNENIATIVNKWVQSVLPDPKEREDAFLAADNSIPIDKLTPHQKLVVEQLNGINELIGLRKQEMYPGFKTVDNYFQRIPIPGSEPAEEQPKSGKALGQATRADFHRSIWKFVPQGGDGKAKPFIQSTQSPKFKLQQNPENRTLWLDPATGQGYQMTHATVREIEKALPVRYIKDVGDVAAQNINDFLNQKEHHYAVEAIKNGIWNGDIVSPGEAAGPTHRLVDVKGLEGWKASPQAATALENLSHDPSISKWEKGYAKGENFVTNLVFYNALKHPLNMMNLALGYSGQFRTGNPVLDAVMPGPLGMAKLISKLPEANDVIMSRDQRFWDMKDAGSNIGTFGKSQTEGFVKKYQQKTATQQGMAIAGKYNPGAMFYKGNKAIVGHIDDVLRTALTLTYRDAGMDMGQAVSEADKNMVDYGNMSRGEKRAQRLAFMFYPWLKGLLGGVGRMAKNPIQYRGSIQNFALMGLAGLGANMAFQQFTGNKDASIDQYGLNNFINQITKAPGEAMSGRIPTVVGSHFLRPILKEGIQQAFNKDMFTGQPIYDPNKIVSESQLGQMQPGQAALRIEHGIQGLAAPAAPFLKSRVISDYLQNKGIPMKTGSQTPMEAGANYLGFKTPHTAGHDAAPALAGANSPLASLNLPNANKTTGIATLNFEDQLKAQTDPGTRQKASTVSQLLSQAYAEGNPYPKMQAYGLIQKDPKLAEFQSKLEVGIAQNEGKPVNPMWAIGISDPAAQKIVLQYKALLPSDQQNFKSDPKNAAVLGAFDAAQADYYQQVLSQAQTGIAKAGFQPPAMSNDVSNLLNQAKATKNYALYNDPRVQAWFTQMDMYDTYVMQQAGLPGTGYNSATGNSKKTSYTPYSNSNSAAAYFTNPTSQAKYMDQYMLRQLMAGQLNQSTQGTQIALKAPTVAVKPTGALAALKLKGVPITAPLPGQGKLAAMPKISRVKFQVPSYSPTKLSGGNIKTIQ